MSGLPLDLVFTCPGVRLFVSGAAEAADRSVFVINKLTHVVNLAGTENQFPTMVAYQTFHILDMPNAEISVLFPAAIDFLERARSSGKEVSMLVHCMAGVSRSASVALAMMVHLSGGQLTPDAALMTMAEARPIVCPNPGFRAQLAEWWAHRGGAPHGVESLMGKSGPFGSIPRPLSGMTGARALKRAAFLLLQLHPPKIYAKQSEKLDVASYGREELTELPERGTLDRALDSFLSHNLSVHQDDIFKLLHSDLNSYGGYPQFQLLWALVVHGAAHPEACRLGIQPDRVEALIDEILKVDRQIANTAAGWMAILAEQRGVLKPAPADPLNGTEIC